MHKSFYTGYDLAGAEQGIWQIAFNKGQFNTLWGANNWANRMYIFNLPLGAIYRLLPETGLLFLLQSITLGMGAILVYRFANEQIRDSNFPVVITIMYLIYPMLHHINLFDFHTDVFAIPFILGAMCFATTNPILLFLFSILAMMCKEDVALTISAIGIYLFLKGYRWKGLGLFGLSIIWLIVTVVILMPIFNEGKISPYIQWFYEVYGDTPIKIITYVLTHPFLMFYKVFIEHGGFQYLIKISVGLGFLPFLAPEVLVIMLPHFLINFLSEFAPQHRIDLHYGAYDIPVLFISAIIGYKRLYGRITFSTRGTVPFKAFSHTVMLILAVVSSFFLGPFKDINKFLLTERSFALQSAVNMIPPHVSVSASECVIPHLAKRNIAYMFPNPFQHVNWTGNPTDKDYALFLAGEEPGYYTSRGRGIEYIIIDRKPPPAYYPLTNKMETIIEELIKNRRYKIFLDNPYVLILKQVEKEEIT
ncbi:MAG: DUF2079 domain-containing protein [Nitrospinae bacterium]|nr:DUF2079 domain-containing protein [Nitrospinota bacterium]